jgi:uncharacterized protein YecE (DUF72 family)
LALPRDGCVLSAFDPFTMKYGKLDNISDIDFTLPVTPFDFIPHGPAATPKVYTGGTMWNIPAWIGKVYPPGTKQKDFLTQYARQFGTIELNATHYKIPTPETVKSWCAQTPEDFVFCPKLPQSISHYRRFTQCEAITTDFILALEAFGHRLGPVFIQLPPHFGPDKASLLHDYMLSLPTDLVWAVEFRHPGWFTSGEQAEDFWQFMVERNIWSVISDTAGRRDAVHMRITGSGIIVRFGGNNLDPTDEQRLSDWALRLEEWSKSGLQTFHLWMHQPESLHTPESCIQFADMCNYRMNVRLKRPVLHSAGELPGLFD